MKLLQSGAILMALFASTYTTEVQAIRIDKQKIKEAYNAMYSKEKETVSKMKDSELIDMAKNEV